MGLGGSIVIVIRRCKRTSFLKTHRGMRNTKWARLLGALLIDTIRICVAFFGGFHLSGLCTVQNCSEGSERHSSFSLAGRFPCSRCLFEESRDTPAASYGFALHCEWRFGRHLLFTSGRMNGGCSRKSSSGFCRASERTQGGEQRWMDGIRTI
jgi:hypothetical protein